MSFAMSALQLAFGDQIPGGMADGADPMQFDREALARGMRVELEHTDDPSRALEIAMDHLVESPCYYDELEEMEEELDEEGCD